MILQDTVMGILPSTMHTETNRRSFSQIDGYLPPRIMSPSVRQRWYLNHIPYPKRISRLAGFRTDICPLSPQFVYQGSRLVFKPEHGLGKR